MDCFSYRWRPFEGIYSRQIAKCWNSSCRYGRKFNFMCSVGNWNERQRAIHAFGDQVVVTTSFTIVVR